MATFFKRIHDLRVDNDLKQKDIAAILKVNVNTYPHWESGMYEIPIEMVDRLSKFYNCSVDYLTGLSTGAIGEFIVKSTLTKIYLLTTTKTSASFPPRLSSNSISFFVSWGVKSDFW